MFKKVFLIVGVLIQLPCIGQTVINDVSSRVDTLAQQGQVLTAEIKSKVEYTKGVLQKVKELNNYTERLTLESVKNLPISITKNLGGQRYDILIDKARFTTYGAELDAKFVFVLPKTEDTIYFEASGIPLHEGGLTSDVRLSLLYAPPIQLSDKMSLQFMPDNSGTYVSFNCDGYKGMGISARVIFSESMLVRDLGNGKKGAGTVSASFTTSFEEWNEFTASLTFSSPFQLSCLKGFGFTVYDAVIDLSDLSTPGSVTFPSDYYVNDRSIWQGIYIREFEVRFPKAFNRRSDARSLSLSGQHILIDALGVSGNFQATGTILPLTEGDMNGWDFSLDSVAVTFMASQITGGGISGEMMLPIKKGSSQRLRYVANIYSGDDYLFAVGLGNKLEMDLWNADLALLQGSFVEVKVEDGELFKPKAVLTGNLSINNPKLKLNRIDFEALTIETEAPYLSAKAFGLASNDRSDKQEMNSFPVSLQEINLAEEGNGMYGLRVNAVVHLSENSSNSFGGAAIFTVFGKITKDPRFEFKFDKVDISAIRVDISSAGFTLQGLIVSYNDHAVYGKGFKGMVKASVVEVFSADVTVQFGSVNGFRYWYFDGSFVQPVGIPVFTGLSLYGFGGGACHRMRREIIGGEKKLDNPDKNEKKEDRSLEPGITLSGVRYIPDQSRGIALRASVIFGAPVPKTYNGELYLEVGFTSSGGLGNVGIGGRLLFANPIEERFSNDAPIMATVDITYYVPEKTLSAGASIRINLPGGISGGGNLALYISPSKWYYYIGHPEDRMRLSLAGIAQVTSYLMIGNEIPPMPLLPAIIREKLQISDQRDQGELSSGKGFCFGVSLDFNSGDKTFLAFYARFMVLAGMDVMIRYYDKDQICTNTGSRPGFGGFYANGQLYAYLQGDIGIKAKVCGIEKKFRILSIGAGVALRVKAPKPTWFNGIVSGEYNILDGLIQGRCRFELEMGEACQMSAGNLMANVKIISSVTPTNQEQVNVFTIPRAALAISESKQYNVTDENNNTRTFSVRIAYLKVLDGNTEIRGTQQWNTKRDLVSFMAHEILPPNKTLVFKVKAYFVEIINGAVVPYKVNGQLIEEETSVSFRTGDAPNYVPSSNIVYSYPMEGQYNVYKSEYPKGYVQLQMGQSYLFGSKVDQTKWNQVARLESGSVQTTASFNYDAETKRIEFVIPNNLENNKVWRFNIVNISKASTSSQNSGQTTSSTSYSEGQIQVRSNNLTGNQIRAGEIKVFDLNFRTSRYNTFVEKMRTAQLNTPTNWSLAPGISQVAMNITMPELMDAFELSGNNNANIKPLMQIQSEQTNVWYTQNLNPLLYNEYPMDASVAIVSRDTSVLGLVPTKAVFMTQTNATKILSSEEASSQTAMPIGGMASVVYDVSWFAAGDYGDMRQQAAGVLTYASNPGQRLINLVTSSYPNVSSGKYVVRVYYVLPGTNQVTSSFPLTLINP
ncbi:MAG: hypothetical protein MUF42_15865 [Cytophagaceae bacterium]|jgi:hypothetical protein|nr:hypothetical protein [Cytophagaceae bacterium]